MERMTEIPEEYFTNISKEQMAKNWEALKEFNEFGADVVFLLNGYKFCHD